MELSDRTFLGYRQKQLQGGFHKTYRRDRCMTYHIIQRQIITNADQAGAPHLDREAGTNHL